MGWGGVIASGIAGGISGAAQAGVDDIVERQKQEALKLRDQSLAELARGTYAANAQTDINNIGAKASATSNAALANAPTDAAAESIKWDQSQLVQYRDKSIINSQAEREKQQGAPVSAGSSVRTGTNPDGTPIWAQAPNKASDEMMSATADDKRADAEKKRADARLADAKASGDVGPGSKSNKFDIANFSVTAKDPLGNPTEGFDQSTGISYLRLPGDPGHKGDPTAGFNIPFIGKVGEDKDVAATPSTMKFFRGGKEITWDDVQKFYPKSAGAKGDSATTVNLSRGAPIGVEADNPSSPLSSAAKAALEGDNGLLEQYRQEAVKTNPDPEKIAAFQSQIRSLVNSGSGPQAPAAVGGGSAGLMDASASASAPLEGASLPQPKIAPQTAQYGPPATDPKTNVRAHKNLLTGKWERM